MLDECLRVGKKVLITLPNAGWKHYWNDSNIGAKNPEHLWHPTKKNVNSLFSGLDCKKITSKNKEFLFIEILN
ncbi:MAG: hypothetical protein ACP5C3_01520 [Methanomicrobiales archaeon]